MKAMVMKEFGGPEVLELQDVEKPEPGATELRVKVIATSVNPVDFKIREQGGSFGLEAPAILGFDASGVVDAVGAEVEDFKPGDEVFYTSELMGSQGCNAEFHVVDESIVALKPENLSHEEAAAIPLAGGTAWQALMVRAGLRLGESVLIHGAGGVGAFATQIAVAAGARVFVSCSETTIESVKSWGAERVMNYKTDDFVEIVGEATGGEGVNIVFNTAGEDLLTRSVPVTADFGYLVGILNPGGTLEGAYRKNLSVELVMLQRERTTMVALRELVVRGLLKPVIDSVVNLDDLAEAHRRLEQGGIKGKIVVRVAD